MDTEEVTNKAGISKSPENNVIQKENKFEVLTSNDDDQQQAILDAIKDADKQLAIEINAELQSNQSIEDEIPENTNIVDDDSDETEFVD
jgi:2-methylcitrate dehydratase PrpD